MEIVPFTGSHIAGFLNSALHEGWLSDRREIEFLLGTYPDGCRVALCEGREAGFITAARYVTSAWIGNLLVLPEQRRRGVGRALLEKVLQTLDLSGCEIVWLTASADGAHLYRTLGFIQIDKVQRWRGSTALRRPPDRAADPETLKAVDSSGWGDYRPAIYELMAESCHLFCSADGFLASAAVGGCRHIGPWGAFSGEAAAALFDAAIGHDSIAMDTCLDVPAGNSAAGEILRLRGFSVSGATLLMYRGKEPGYRAEHVFSLASMGSYG